MATYATLELDDKALIDELTKQLRVWSGDLNRLLTMGQHVSDLFASGGTDIINTLDAGDLIPNTSGLNGTQALTKEEVIELLGDINVALNAYRTQAKRTLQSKAAGIGTFSRG